MTIHKFTQLLESGLHIENLKRDDYLLCIYGEVDVRHHFANQIKIKNRNIDEIIDTLVDNYMKSLKNHIIAWYDIITQLKL